MTTTVGKVIIWLILRHLSRYLIPFLLMVPTLTLHLWAFPIHREITIMGSQLLIPKLCLHRATGMDTMKQNMKTRL